MGHFIMFMGIPGSGKSTLAEKIARKNQAVVVSTDQLRKELTGSESDFSMDGAVFREALQRIRQFLFDGFCVVYDATNLTTKDRKRVLKVIPEGIQKTCVFRKIPFHLAVKRNLNRKRVVPVEIIARMARKLDKPSMEEGWDEIRVVNPEELVD